MAKFSASALKKELQAKANEVARSKNVTYKIAKKAEETMQKVIKKKIYYSYSPVSYERRGDNDGLSDMNNIISVVSGNRIIVENVAEPNESIFGTPLREQPYGLLYQWFDEGSIAFGGDKWRVDRMGLDLEIQKDPYLRDFIGEIIAENIK